MTSNIALFSTVCDGKMFIEKSLFPSLPSVSKCVWMCGMSKARVVDWIWLLIALSDDTIVIDPFLNCEQTNVDIDVKTGEKWKHYKNETKLERNS